VSAKPVALALVTVVIGTVVAYGWGSPESGTVYWTVGVAVQFAGTAGLAAVLLRTVVELRRVNVKQPRHSGPHAPLMSHQVRGPEPVETSSAALRDGAAVRR